MLVNFLSVCLGGACGSCLRYYTTLMALKYINQAYCATFLVNIIGCFLIGLIGTYLSMKVDVQPFLKPLITFGFLGGLTTFSTFSFEVFNFLKEGKVLFAFSYMLLSVICGLLFTYIGYLIAIKCLIK